MVSDLGRIAVVALALSALAGCTGSRPLTLSKPDNWGEANRQTIAAQIVDPAPQYDTQVSESSGDHAARAYERYRTGTVKQPDRVRTSTISTGGSGN